jgi:hypothetical protein
MQRLFAAAVGVLANSKRQGRHSSLITLSTASCWRGRQQGQKKHWESDFAAAVGVLANSKRQGRHSSLIALSTASRRVTR